MKTTAKQFFKNEAKKLQSDWEDVPLWMIDSAIKFAKLHCLEQSKVISEKAATILIEDQCPLTGQEFEVREIDKNSILNAYPLDLIK
jgi:hypothetical protein